MNRNEKIKLLKNLNNGRTIEAMKQLWKRSEDERITYALSKISYPLLDLFFYALRTDTRRKEVIDLLTNFYNVVQGAFTDCGALLFIEDFETEHEHQIASLLREFKIDPANYNLT